MKDKILIFLYRYGLIIGGVFMLLVSLIILRNGYLDKQMTEKNEKVTVKVIGCTKDRNGNYFFEFEFDNEVFLKRTKAQYCRYLKNENEAIMLTNKNRDRFIFRNEYKTNNNFIYGILFMGIALVIVFKGFKNRNKLLD